MDFGQISGAKVIVESSLPNLPFVLSQGSHFFHNVTSFKILYFSVRHDAERGIDWQWLRSAAGARRGRGRAASRAVVSDPRQGGRQNRARSGPA